MVTCAIFARITFELPANLCRVLQERIACNSCMQELHMQPRLYATVFVSASFNVLLAIVPLSNSDETNLCDVIEMF